MTYWNKLRYNSLLAHITRLEKQIKNCDDPKIKESLQNDWNKALETKKEADEARNEMKKTNYEKYLLYKKRKEQRSKKGDNKK